MKFTKKELEYLKGFETNFTTAINSKYTRNIPSKQLDELISIYKKVTNKNDYNLCKHCGSSVLAFIQTLGKMYFEELKITEEKKQRNGKTRESKQVK